MVRLLAQNKVGETKLRTIFGLCARSSTRINHRVLIRPVHETTATSIDRVTAASTRAARDAAGCSTDGPQTPPLQQEIDQIRRERAQRKTQDVEVQMGAMTLEFNNNLRLTVEEDWHCENGDAIAGLQWAGGVRLARFFDDRSVFPEDYWRDKQVLELEPARA